MISWIIYVFSIKESGQIDSDTIKQYNLLKQNEKPHKNLFIKWNAVYKLIF